MGSRSDISKSYSGNAVNDGCVECVVSHLDCHIACGVSRNDNDDCAVVLVYYLYVSRIGFNLGYAELC